MIRAISGSALLARTARPRAVETERPIHILLVEDNPADTRLLIETLREERVLVTLSVVTDGESALQFLRREHPYTHAHRPDLVLADLTLPRCNGPELMAEIRSDPQLRSVPVALLTASIMDEVLLSTLNIQADFCIRKPVDLQQLVRLVAHVDGFGIRITTTTCSDPRS